MYSKLKLNWLHHWFNNINNTRDAYTTLYRLFRLVTCYGSRPREGYPEFSHQSQANSRPKHHFASYLVFKERSKSETQLYAHLPLTSMAFKKNFDNLDRCSFRAQNGIRCLQEIWTRMPEVASTRVRFAELVSIFRKKHPEMRSNYPPLLFENSFQYFTEFRFSRKKSGLRSRARALQTRSTGHFEELCRGHADGFLDSTDIHSRQRRALGESGLALFEWSFID